MRRFWNAIAAGMALTVLAGFSSAATVTPATGWGVDAWVNNVTLYASVNSGFQYANTDAPEPGAFIVAGIGVLLLVAGGRRFRKR